MNSNHTGKTYYDGLLPQKYGNPQKTMNKITKINPIAKLLGNSKYRNKTIPNKKKSKLDKLAKKELIDGKTSKDT